MKDLLQTHMVFIKGGTFRMGSSEEDPDTDWEAKPRHEVTLSDFFLSKYPVTQSLWLAVMGSDPEKLHFKGCDQCPAEGISWHHAQEFLKKLNSKTGKSYRLPSEAEWEFAACGGLESKGYEYAGGNELKLVAWLEDNSDDKIHPVGELAANELGLHDMSGNVWEWCQDWHGSYPKEPQTNPEGPKTGGDRVLRGGSWNYSLTHCRVSNRMVAPPRHWDYDVGFRLAHS